MLSSDRSDCLNDLMLIFFLIRNIVALLIAAIHHRVKFEIIMSFSLIHIRVDYLEYGTYHKSTMLYIHLHNIIRDISIYRTST